MTLKQANLYQFYSMIMALIFLTTGKCPKMVFFFLDLKIKFWTYSLEFDSLFRKFFEWKMRFSYVLLQVKKSIKQRHVNRIQTI